MDTFRSMKIFVEVAEAGSFTAAANHFDATAGYVSRAISELETHLRTRLLNRTTRRIALTEAGERYLGRCHAILASVSEAEAEASDAHAKPVGTLKVHAMSSIGQNYVVPAVAAYQERYPAVTVDLTLSQNVPDLLEDGYDVALRVSPEALPDSNYISRPLGTVHSVLCAAPAYLGRHGNPETVSDLSRHMCLQVAMPIFPADRWLLEGVEGVSEFVLPHTRFKVNVPDALAAALHEGMGIGALPTLTVRSAFRNGSLVRVLPDYYLQPLNIHAVYASRQYLDAKIKTWIEFLQEWVAEALREDEVAFGKAK
ncbi:Transcriptional regulator, LysR family [Caballeronia glathei]|jgi:DNA-binding transcriptional LysR family regulator|uniref:LysR family transcriptional regulator n=1 Tax=Caballeronia glathei TaxID=60547 RepID=A0A069PVG0_9BURK|nr:LysR family transcriptional regulator [Caballeronia glathei]KDR41326.1 LysR family transcriptional regulator [Caballeronia glathei]CDY78455.1 Transcriptional regulator, LysR family [Caballeronia glathei]